MHDPDRVGDHLMYCRRFTRGYLCFMTGEHFLRTDASTTTALFSWNPQTSTCSAYGGGTYYSYFSVGAEVTPTTIATSVDSAPGQRIQLVHAGAGAARLATGAYDTQLGFDCAPSTATDGVQRCIPSAADSGGISSAFSDAGCSQPIDVVVTSGVPQNFAVKDLGTGCAPIGEVHAVGAAITTPIYLNNGTCMPLTGYTLSAVGAVLDPSMMAAATLVTDS